MTVEAALANKRRKGRGEAGKREGAAWGEATGNQRSPIPRRPTTADAARRPAGAANTAAALRRRLGAWGAAAFVVCNMVGAGIFTVPAFVRAATGSAPAALGVWAAGGLVALCGALCYAELATRMPAAGAEYQYLRRVYGPRAGFLSGTVSFAVGFAAATAAASLGAVAYGAALLPGWDPAATLLGFEQGALAAAGFIVLTAALHSRGVGVSGRLQAALATLIVAGVAAFVVLGFAGGRGSFAALAAGDGATGGGGWWIAFLQVSFAYSGWNAAAYLAEEVDEPARTLPRALIGGTLLVTAVYLALNAVFFYALPDAAWGATIAIGRDAALALFGREVATALSGLVALAILGSVSAMAAAGPRVYFAMARDGLAPSVVARVNPHNGAPVVAIWAQAVLAATLALTGAFEALLVYIGSALLLFAAAAVAALLILRWRERGSSVAETDGGRGKTPHGGVSLQVTPTGGGTRMFRAPGGPIPAVVFLAAATLAWINGLLQQPVPTLAALATIGAGALLYTIGSRRSWLRRSPCES